MWDNLPPAVSQAIVVLFLGVLALAIACVVLLRNRVSRTDRREELEAKFAEKSQNLLLDTLKELKEKNEKNAADIVLLREDKAASATKNDGLQTQVNELKHDLADARTASSQRDQQIGGLSKTNEIQASQIKELTVASQEFHKAKNDATVQLHEAGLRQLEAEKERDSARAALDKANELNKSLQELNDSLQGRLTAAEAQIVTMQEQIDSLMKAQPPVPATTGGVV